MVASKRYVAAGVDQKAADAFASSLGDRVRQGEDTVAGIGSFASATEVPAGLERPVVVSACDGVGTKTILLREAGMLKTAGRDLVAACVNDVACAGARPWLFHDYIGCASFVREEADEVIAGVLDACAEAGCELAGGETAQLPGLVADGGYELVGFATGIVERAAILGPERVEPGDALVGILADGLHCNGYSLVRQELVQSGSSLDDAIGSKTLADILLAPTPLYSQAVLGLIEKGVDLRSAAHITGGGLAANVARALPVGAGADIDRSAWKWGQAHEWLSEAGRVDGDEMLVATNGGIGFVLVVPDASASMLALEKMGMRAVALGTVNDGGLVRVG